MACAKFLGSRTAGALSALALCLIMAQRSAFAVQDCFDAAASYHQVSPDILRSIAIQENWRCDGTVRRNSNGSIDVGCMQINSIHFSELSRFGIAPSDLLDQCKNIYIGAWHYKKMMRRYGNTWMAVGAYHSETIAERDSYALKVYKIWLRYFSKRER
ncbi:lytic transglycosylase domain-containing protein [Undibacterium arcticum]|uniref:Lytic transglycosylase domain-containing protein n=1 Tax=Undibacterium arcticum TaxID=1762892 RepID=A0ABV7F5G3_9BURK